MEESISEPETHQCLPRRRRSTFFERRESLAPQATSDIDPNASKKCTSDDDQRRQDLSRYCEKLLAEKEQWKKEAIRRRNNYHDLRDQYKMSMKVPARSRINYSVLSDEDIEFVKGKFNIKKFVDSQMELHSSVKVACTAFTKMKELEETVLQSCEDKVDEITEYIFENSTIE